MKVFVVLALVAACSAAILPHAAHYAPGYVARVPSHDSAVIQSHRLGGNFAYRTDEAHAYASVHPVVSHVTVPVAETYHTPISYVQPVSYEVTHHGYAPVAGYHHAYAAPHGYAGLHAYGAPLYRGLVPAKAEAEADEE